MELTNNTEPAVIPLSGNIRMGEAVDTLRLQVENSLNAGHSRLVINMEKVTGLDSSGIGVLVRSLTLAKQKGGNVKLVSVPTVASQTLRLTGVLKLFGVYQSNADAIQAFQDSSATPAG